MKTRIYTVKDVVVNSFMMPFYAVNDGHAKRICADLVSAGDTPPAQHPSDFDLYCCGEYDDQSGVFETFPPVFMIRFDQLGSFPVDLSYRATDSSAEV